MAHQAFSRSRLARMHETMSAHVARGDVPGMVTLLSRQDEVHIDVIGNKSVEGDPMRRDTIFRITSMTKPITAVAAMILVEECKIRLDEPIERFIPELAGRAVLERIDGPLDDTVPACRPITLRDLLTFRLGWGLLMGSPSCPILDAIKELELVGFGPPNPAAPYDSDEWLRRLSTLPLMYQPGSRWMYNTGSYILGVLISRAAGQPLEAFLQERIFDPLNMKDTAFSVPPEKLDRFVTSYWPNPTTGALDLFDGVSDSAWGRPPRFPDAGAGLVSTVDDYLAFGQMLLNRGALAGERILSRPSVEAMTTDQLTDAQKAVSGFVPGYWDSRGWGFGLCVVTQRDAVASIPGRYGWDGGYGTSWSTDPSEQMVAILMTQRAGFPLFSNVWLDFWTSAYQALEE